MFTWDGRSVHVVGMILVAPLLALRLRCALHVAATRVAVTAIPRCEKHVAVTGPSAPRIWREAPLGMDPSEETLQIPAEKA